VKIKFILTLLLIFVTSFCHSQYRWRSQFFSSRFADSLGEWTKYTDWQPSGILITANKETQRVIVYSSNKQIYDMVDKVQELSDNEGNPIYKVGCLDENGSRCTMTWYHRKDGESFVIFSFSNLELMYKVNLLTD